jgi:hypothetical protein
MLECARKLLDTADSLLSVWHRFTLRFSCLHVVYAFEPVNLHYMASAH